MVLGKILALKASTAQGQRLQGLRGSPSWCFRIGEGANKLPELEGRCWLNFFVVLQGKGLVLSRGYVRIGGLFWWFLQTETGGIWRGKDGIRSIEMQCFDIDFFFFYFLFIHFFLYCRRKDLSANASVPHFGTLDIFSCLFQVLKFLTTHPSACKLLASRKRPCSPNMVSFLPSSKSSLTQLHLRSLGHLSTWTLSDMSPSRFPPLLISLWLAELY